jgi:MoxR-like ATPase
MMNEQIRDEKLEYKDLPNCQPPPDGLEDLTTGRRYYPYTPDLKLVKAVNLAILLKRPLLIEGEPGCGKTRLADAIAYQFSRMQIAEQRDSDLHKEWWHYGIWNVKSNGQARDGLYRFDAVGRLRDAQLVGSDPDKLKDLMGEDFDKLKARLQGKESDNNGREKNAYITFGKLGEALWQTKCDRPIVLIDEIDKADSDFQNDLLYELDRLSFEIPETGETYPNPKGNFRPYPIVIITSNRERQLPEPFLRRCLYYYLDFPDTPVLTKIIKSRFGQKAIEQKELVAKTIAHFNQIREELKGKPSSKSPGTSELIDLVEVLLDANTSAADRDLAQLVKNPHILGIILKTKDDHELYRSAVESGKFEHK